MQCLALYLTPSGTDRVCENPFLQSLRAAKDEAIVSTAGGASVPAEHDCAEPLNGSQKLRVKLRHISPYGTMI